jgi:mannose-6-phosphate isomerase-like protein (cupin superfamily)
MKNTTSSRQKGNPPVGTEKAAGFKPEYIITEMKKDVVLAWGLPDTPLEEYIPGENRSMEHVLYIDGEVGPGTFYSECLWFFPQDMVSPKATKKMAEMMKKIKPGTKIGPQPHIHPFDELFTFFGSNFEDPSDLGSEIEFWLEDQPVTFDKSCIVYIPAGMRHCPVNMKGMDRTIFHFSMGFTPTYEHTVLDHKSGEYAGEKDMRKYFIFGDKAERKTPAFRKNIPDDFIHRVAHLDSDVVPGSCFHAETSWIWPEERSGLKRKDVTFVDKHTHPFPEIIAFFGTDFDDIHKLHGEVELSVDGRQYKINKSFVVFIPEGVEHGPLTVRNVKKPIFHYTVGHSGLYV